jgi:hypothetical protein
MSDLLAALLALCIYMGFIAVVATTLALFLVLLLPALPFLILVGVVLIALER